MKKNKPETPLNEYVDVKAENRESMERKQRQETNKRNKRKQLREAIEDRDYQ